MALAALAFPVWARTASVPIHSDGTTTIGQTQLKAGDYELKVKENATQMEITRDGKLIAEAPVTWIQLPKSPQNTEVIVDQNRVVEVDFGGKTQAVKIQNQSAANSNGTGQSGSRSEQ
jgi:hypothetical protein